MAEARARISCATDCSAITPSVDVIYDDVWTDEAAAGRPKDVSFSYLYADLLTATAPVSDACQTSWTPACRIVINYEMHIHPLWETPRLAADGITDITCTSCHNTVDAMAVQQVPAGQLDLTGGPSNEQADHFMSYRELLFPDNEQELIMGALQDSAVQIGIDPAMSVAGALASGQFFSRFDAGSTHANYLSDAELKMIAEWLDIGAQYFNNPFDAPIN
jgi:hypothetical protein